MNKKTYFNLNWIWKIAILITLILLIIGINNKGLFCDCEPNSLDFNPQDFQANLSVLHQKTAYTALSPQELSVQNTSGFS